MSYALDPYVVWQYRQALADGAAVTLALTVASAAVSLPIGVVGALAKMSRLAPVRALAATYVEVMRNTPSLVQLYVIYFGLGSLSIPVPPFWAAVAALGLNAGGYVTEIVRGAFAAVPADQRRAAAALAMTPAHALFFVELPQMFRVAWPSLGNQLVGIVLGSSLASVITVPELMYQAQNIGAINYRYFEIFGATAVLYVGLAQGVNGAWRGIAGRAFGKWGATV